jgi:tetratricopeptide (TPR) repeat protein
LETALAKMGGPQAYWSTQVKIQRLAASAWVALAAHDTGYALSLAKEAADLEDVTEKHPVTPGSVLPARELQGDMLLQIGRAADARKAYEATLARSPNRARSLYGAARSAEVAGDRFAARTNYQQYLTVTAKSDGTRPEIEKAKQFLAQR